MTAYLFDIGNVLLRFDFTPAARQLALLSEASTEEILTLLAPFKDDLESGRISDADFIQQSSDLIRFRGTSAEFAAIWNDIFTPNEPMIPLIEALAQQHPLYLLSNTSGLHKDYFFAKYPFFSHFKGGIFSHEARCAKPGEAIFQRAIVTFDLDPASTVFIDDLADNIATARRLGFVAHHYHHENHQVLLAQLGNP
ncbi:HAD family phosphatase [Phragmitibacter flavus]|uniref:HAD family phosphatase n=1 Tax=Phragmitibacter flavus TaxID=2576071 RepID=A0A5R8K8Q9_9BACT|nr:HAD family phosphatase [Phragmitibacter flavus]TLD68335.1 HAD family phosphatase [Phragmitibacter flavus]